MYLNGQFPTTGPGKSVSAGNSSSHTSQKHNENNLSWKINAFGVDVISTKEKRSGVINHPDPN